MLIHLTLAALASFVLAAQTVRQPPTAPPLKTEFEAETKGSGSLLRGT